METNPLFVNTINEDQQINDNINRSCLNNFCNYMNPTIGATACACCGRVDILISIEYFEINDLKIPSDIITFYPYNIHNHILDPLIYTDEENIYYNSEVPHDNIENNQHYY